MLGPQKLSQAPVGTVHIFLGLQDWVINQIAQLIAKFGVITSSAEYLMTAAMEQNFLETDFHLRLKVKLQQTLDLSDKEISKLFNSAAKANYIYDKRAFQQRGIPFTPYEDNYFIQQMVRGISENTSGTMKNVTRTMGFAIKTSAGTVFSPMADFLHQELDSAAEKVIAGVQTMEGAIKESVKRMADSGLRTVDYASGKKDRIDVAARRAVMGGMKDLTNGQSDYNARVMGVTTYEISWHGGHRPSHGWGGKRFDLLGILYPTEQELYDDYPDPKGKVGNLEDYNCYHEKYAVFPDSPPAYTDEQLDDLETGELESKEYQGKWYNAWEARKQQRFLERKEREQSSVIAGLQGALEGGADVAKELQEAKILKRKMRADYKEFCSTMNLPPEVERINTGFVA